MYVSCVSRLEAPMYWTVFLCPARTCTARSVFTTTICSERFDSGRFKFKASDFFLKKKSEVLDKFKEFEAKMTNWTGCRINTSNEIQQYLKLKGIINDVTVPYSPEQNGVAQQVSE